MRKHFQVCVDRVQGWVPRPMLIFVIFVGHVLLNVCGVIFQKNDEFSVAVAVRLHKTLELAGDKFYMITCGKAGFQNTR